MNTQVTKKLSPLYFWAIFIGLLLVGFWLRVRQLTASDFWYDEAFTAIVIRAPWDQMWAYLAADKVHPPLYYLLLRSWVTVLGTSVAAIRGFSLLFGMAIPPMIYAITQKFSSTIEKRQQFGLTMMALFTISPFFSSYSVEARSYSFLAFLVLVSVYLFFNATKNLYRWDSAKLYFILSLVAIGLTHYLSILIILGYIVAYLILMMIDKKWFYDSTLWGNIAKLLIVGWIGSTYLWQYFHLEKLLEKGNLGWIPQADLSTFIRVVYVFLFGVDRQSLGLPQINQFSFPLLTNSVGMLILVASIVAIVLTIQASSKKESELKDIVMVLAIGAIPLVCMILASSLGLHVYVDRYVIGYGTMLLLTFGYAWWSLVGDSLSYGVAFYALLLLFLVFPKSSTKYSDTYNLVQTYGASVQVVVEDPLDFVVFKSYFGQENVSILQQKEGSFYGWALIAQNEEELAEKIGKGTLIIRSNSSSREVPNSWEKLQEANGFAIWKVN